MTYREHTLGQLALAQLPHDEGETLSGLPEVQVTTEEGHVVTLIFDRAGGLWTIEVAPAEAETCDTDEAPFRFRHGQRVQLPQHGGVGEVVLQRLTRRAVLGDVVEYAVQCPDGEVVWHYEPDLVAVEDLR